jgi:hypothetical protein
MTMNDFMAPLRGAVGYLCVLAAGVVMAACLWAAMPVFAQSARNGPAPGASPASIPIPPVILPVNPPCFSTTPIGTNSVMNPADTDTDPVEIPDGTNALCPPEGVLADGDGSVPLYAEYDKKVLASEQVSPLTSEMFGDSVSPYLGQTEFNVVDIDLPGNNARNLIQAGTPIWTKPVRQSDPSRYSNLVQAGTVF